MSEFSTPAAAGPSEPSPRAWVPPARVTAHLRTLMDPRDRDDPIARQFLPSSAEARVAPGESADPLGEQGIEAAPRLLHRYPDRVLLLVSDRCAACCRYCFRRESLGRRGGGISDRELAAAAAYVAGHPEVRELILSGGDPLTLPGRRLSAIFAAFRGGAGCRTRPGTAGPGPGPAGPGDPRAGPAYRVHTRVPVVAPRRVTEELVERLRAARPLRAVIQVNHPRELAPRCLEAIAALQGAGIPVLSQGVLLRGVNDDPEVLAELWRRLVEVGVRPHHLFQPDLARGTAHFRVDLERAVSIYREAAGRVEEGEAAPGFALDLPGGGGKVLLTECEIRREGGGFYRVAAPDGRSALYPLVASAPEGYET